MYGDENSGDDERKTMLKVKKGLLSMSNDSPISHGSLRRRCNKK